MTFTGNKSEIQQFLFKPDRKGGEMRERWRFIPNSDNEYIVSDLGNVMSLPKQHQGGQGKYMDNGVKLSPINNNQDYLYVYVKINGKRKKEYIHRLVAKAFIPNPQNKQFINHKDCNPQNNRFDNLEWCTPQENVDYMISLGRNKRTKEWLEKLHKSQEKQKKSVIGIEISTGKMVSFSSMHEAEQHGFRASDICTCCKKKRKTAFGYTWYYAEEFENGFIK